MSSDPNNNKTGIPKIDQLVASATRIRFPTGAFGKTCMLVVIFALACAAIAWSVRNPYVSSLALVIVAGVAFYALRRAFNFADSNPSAAILEGAEFVKHEQIRMAAKGVPHIPASDIFQANEPGQVPLIEDTSVINTPDDPSTDTGEQPS